MPKPAASTDTQRVRGPVPLQAPPAEWRWLVAVVIGFGVLRVRRRWERRA